MAERSSPTELPSQFGRYRVKKKLGGGGMGTVYLVENTDLEREEALKVPHFVDGNDPQVRERFLREAKSAARLDHANLCPVYDAGVQDGIYYLTMRLLTGKLLSDYTGKAQPARKAVEIVIKLAQALEAAHGKGVIHRDLKPSNVMMVAGVGPVVMDFGLAKQVQQPDKKLTQTGSMLGTPGYMPPEQVKGDLERMGPASDVYSLGVILFELLTGQLPFAGTLAAVLAQILFSEPPLPSALVPGLGLGLDAICRKAMAKEATERYPSMKAFAAVLTVYLRKAHAKESGRNLMPTATDKSTIALPAGKAGIFQAPTVAPGPRIPTTVPPQTIKAIPVPAVPPSPSRQLRLPWVISALVGFVVCAGVITLAVINTNPSQPPKSGETKDTNAFTYTKPPPTTTPMGGGERIKVGILHSLTGTMAISESSLKDVELMAIDEINKAGGVLGKQIEAIVEDPQSKFTDVFPEKARKLLLNDNVVAVFGCWTSVSRKNVQPVFEENNGLLFYPVRYEGNECSKNVVYNGASPNRQIIPAVEWLLKKGYKKFYLLGSDYVFPRTANLIIVKYLKSKGLDPVAEKYTPLGHLEYATIVQDIKKAEPDVIFSTINGDSNVNFYNELAAQGITAGDVDSPGKSKDQIPVVAVSVGEDELRGLDPSKVKGHLAAWNYYQSVDTPENKAFVKKFKDKYGMDRVTDDPIAAAYAQVYLWKLAVDKAKSTEVDAVRKALLTGIEFDAPEGKIKVDPKNQHVYKKFRMGKIRADKQFDIIFETPTWIEPDPYPQVAFPGWNCDWTGPGLIKGNYVKVLPK